MKLLTMYAGDSPQMNRAQVARHEMFLVGLNLGASMANYRFTFLDLSNYGK